MRLAIALSWLVAALLPIATARAHDFTPGVLSVVEITPGTYRYRWTPPVDSARPMRVSVRFPRHCERGVEQLDCGDAGLAGEIAFEGMDDPRVRVVVTIERLDGTRVESVVDGGEPAFSLERAPGSSALAWLVIGAEHVLAGLDHLAFLLGLLLVTGLDRRIVATVTAFTIAHSVTLALATLSVISLASAPVEATIAASVVLVARESTHDHPTLTRRSPWMVAGLFGLVHGLGFAGALADIGLPEQAAGWALLWFNVGVEAGQLAVVALVALIAWLSGGRLASARPVAAYAIGALGAWWLIERTVAMVTGSS